MHSIATFQYTYSNLDLPVFDDFSVNKWVNYPTNYSGSNVTSALYYKLINFNTLIPISAEQGLCDSTSAHKRTIVINGTVVTDTVITYFNTKIPVVVNNLNSFPIAALPPKNLYAECYILVDTLKDGVLTSTQDTIFSTPFYFQDSARVFTADITSSEIWVDDFACHNYRFAIEPKSLGVATLDGVSNTGNPYEFGNSNAYGRADVLTSKPINLAGKSNVYLSFLYQAKGFGNQPEAEDSLILEMYSPQQTTWYNVWAIDGNISDNKWRTAHIEISANTFLDNGFRFRFANKASLAGQLDHWHIDYVNLRENSSANDTIIDDLAIAYPIESFLKNYTAAPWDHYNNLSNPSTKIVENFELLVQNNHTAAKITNAGQLNINGSIFNLPVTSPNWNVGSNIYTFNVGSQPYEFPQNSSLDKAEFDVKMNIATSTTNFITENDTTYFTQSFKNYYSYDDGTAESGYGLLDKNSQLAYKFEAYEADTLTGILMKFIPNLVDVSGNIFLLTIWEDNGGVPGQIIYKDDFFSPHYPEYASNKNQYAYYTFNNNQTVSVPKTYYVGFEQISNQNLYLGFDLNNNNQNNIFYNNGGAWANASYQGSLIMRPVYSTKLNYTLSEKPVLPEKINFSMFPNPVVNQLVIQNFSDSNHANVYDLTGRLLISSTSNTVDFSGLINGIYIVSVNDQLGNTLFTQKIIKQ